MRKNTIISITSLTIAILFGIGLGIADAKAKEVKVQIHTVKGSGITEQQVRGWINKANQIDGPNVVFVVDSNHVHEPNTKPTDPNVNDPCRVNIWGLPKCVVTGEPNYISGQKGNIIEIVPGKTDSSGTNVYVKDSTLAHELNHLLGLEHSTDPNNKMYPDNHPDSNGKYTSCHRKDAQITSDQRQQISASIAVTANQAMAAGHGAETYDNIGDAAHPSIDLQRTAGWIRWIQQMPMLDLAADVNTLFFDPDIRIGFYIEADGDPMTGEPPDGIDYYVGVKPAFSQIIFKIYDIGWWMPLDPTGISFQYTFIDKDAAVPQIPAGIQVEIPMMLMPRRAGDTISYRAVSNNQVEMDSAPNTGLLSMTYPPNPCQAQNPNPADGAEYVDPHSILSWDSGIDVQPYAGHVLFLSTDRLSVEYRDAAVMTYLDTNSFTPPMPLQLNRTYYWCVDERNGPNYYMGDIWSFTVNYTTVAYWRFEDGIPDHPLPDSDGQTIWQIAALDFSENGNHLTTWDYAWAGFDWRTDVPSETIGQTGAMNLLSIQNAGGYPAAMTWSEQSMPMGVDIETISPAQFTIEASFKATFGPGGFHTIVGRDGMYAMNDYPEMAPLYFSVRPQMQATIAFADAAGYDHTLESAPGLITSGKWYNMAAVSDGQNLSLYLNGVLVAQNDMTLSGSPDTSLAIGYGSGSDWQAGTWSVGRGLWNGWHTDRWYGLIDEVRISTVALLPSEFLFTPPTDPNITRPYSKGPVGPNDFKAPVPDINDRTDPCDPTIIIAAEICVGIDWTHEGTFKTDPNGKKIYEPNKIKLKSGTDPNKSWNSDTSDPNLMDHEQGHADLEEIAARKAQAEIDEKLKNGELKGEGNTEEEAKEDLNKKIDEIVAKHEADAQEKYDEDTKHGTDEVAQKKAREEQKKALENSNKDPGQKKGSEAKSTSGNSCTYIPGYGLTFEDSIIVSVPDPLDPVIGGQLIMTRFNLVGQTADGEFWFAADSTSSGVEIQQGGLTYLSTQMDYILYSPLENMFYGLGMAFNTQISEGISAYVDGVCQALTDEGSLTLYGVEIYPQADFMALTAGFTISGESPTENYSGMRIIKLEADINEDFRVNFKDLAIMASQWLQAGDLLSDISPSGGDGMVNCEDLKLLADTWLEGTI